jgi:hypothetical protein
MRYLIAISFLCSFNTVKSQIKLGTYLIQNDNPKSVSLILDSGFRFNYFDIRAAGDYWWYRACGRWSFKDDTLLLEHNAPQIKQHPDTPLTYIDCDGKQFTIKNAIEITEWKHYIYKNDSLFFVAGKRNDSTTWGNFDFLWEK